MIVVFLIVERGFVSVRLPRTEGDAQACFSQDVLPGQSFAGWSFEELQELGSGRHELEDRSEEVNGSAP